MGQRKLHEKGSVSLFVVIFAALLIITIATAFIRIMVQEQSQASANDLAKSALDSANAGVEDAKRAIVEYYQLQCSEGTGGPNETRCNQLRSALFPNAIVGATPENDGWTESCDVTARADIATKNDQGEVAVKTDDKDDALNQAYTCVDVQMNPKDYLGSSVSDMFQLKTKDNAPINRIKVQWYLQQQAGALDLNNDINTLSDGTIAFDLPDRWPEKRPTVMRMQLLQYAADFKPSDFDSDYTHNSTLFLMPTSLTGTTISSFSNDLRKNNRSASLQPVACNPNPAAGSYACEVTIDLPDVGDPAGASPRNAYLNINQLYAAGNTKFRITMLNAANEEVRFADVQPAVDATGRADDIFKRIRSRINLGGGVVPQAAVDVTRRFCKEFVVTNDSAQGGNNPCPLPPGSN